MGCPTTSAQAYENCGAPPQGLASYDGTYAQLATVAANQSKPSGAPSDYVNVCVANVLARGLIYFRSSPGDCGARSAVPGVTGGQIAGLSGTAGSGVVGGLGAAGVIGGAATLGITAAISVAVGAIETLFAHHAAAVTTEQDTICAVANFFNQYIPAIDRAVAAGSITADQGKLFVKQIVNQAQTGLSSIWKSCNAACVYSAILNAHVYFVQTYYDRIAPYMAFAQAPASPPSGPGTPPGGVAVSPGNIAPPVPVRTLPGQQYAPQLGTGPMNGVTGYVPSATSSGVYNQGTGQSVQFAEIPPTAQVTSVVSASESTTNWTMIGAIVGVVGLALVLLRGGR